MLSNVVQCCYECLWFICLFDIGLLAALSDKIYTARKIVGSCNHRTIFMTWRLKFVNIESGGNFGDFLNS